MEVTAYLEPLKDPTRVSSYLVRIWIRGRNELYGWNTSDWCLTDVGSVEDAIAWARERAAGSPCEVLLVTEQEALLRLWGSEPEDSAQTITVPLRWVGGQR